MQHVSWPNQCGTIDKPETNGITREGSRYESHGGQTSTQERRRLLKRTRSLAVISEDEWRTERDPNLRASESDFDFSRRPQLIPRAKLIDRNSLKDRLSKSQQHLSDSYERFNDAKSCHSRSICGLHSIPPALSSFPDSLSYVTRTSKPDPNRLNILNWPKTTSPPQRYCSIQDLDTVSGLVDIVEDYWPIEGDRSLDCIYTQVKRKRKEHRSLDSILFEKDNELEYFDILKLLPLSNVRLELNESDVNSERNDLHEASSKDSKFDRAISFALNSKSDLDRERTNQKIREIAKASSSPHRRNVTDEEKSSKYIKDSENSTVQKDTNKCTWLERSRKKQILGKQKELFLDNEKNKDEQKKAIKRDHCTKIQTRSLLEQDLDKYRADVAIVRPNQKKQETEKNEFSLEEVEETSSIWISDSEDPEDMSRRPQVLKVIDNDVTRRQNRCSKVVEINMIDENMKKKEEEDEFSKMTSKNENGVCSSENEELNVENAKNFENKSIDREASKNRQNEGRFERIVKETTNIIGKACNVVKGSLGFETRSESSDLGLGSECDSDTRRHSVDDGANVNIIRTCSRKSSEGYEDVDEKKSHTSLTRSRSYIDSINCQEPEQPEFDHVRYKIVKSNIFGKNIFGNFGKNDVPYDGLMQYLKEYSFQELLLDNNVVIIEPVRAESVERKSSPSDNRIKPTSTSNTSSIQEKTSAELETLNKKVEKSTEKSGNKTSRQSSLRKHFFYQPIRVNRELIDDELPNPDTVRNVRQMFEATLRTKSKSSNNSFRDSTNRKSLSMKELNQMEDCRNSEETLFKPFNNEESRSRCSSRAKDLTRLFEKMDKVTLSNNKNDAENPRSESKTKILAQSFEVRSGQISPSDSSSSKHRIIAKYHRQNQRQNQCQHHNWDAGSVSSGVSSDYPDTDPGSAPPCISSEDEIECQYEDDGVEDEKGHYVSQDVLRKIREYGTSVTYYGGKVVQCCNGPLISPLSTGKILNKNDQDYVRFRLVKSNSCDSRLELTGRLVEHHIKSPLDLKQCTIVETPSIEIATLKEMEQNQENEDTVNNKEAKREPPIVIGLEPKKEESRIFQTDFHLLKFSDHSEPPCRFGNSALLRWQINENSWKKNEDFGKMEFEEFEVLEDSLNGNNSQSQVV